MSSGTWLAIAADSTPGSVRSRASSRPVKIAQRRVVQVSSRQIVGGEQHALAPEAGIRIACVAEAADEQRRGPSAPPARGRPRSPSTRCASGCDRRCAPPIARRPADRRAPAAPPARQPKTRPHSSPRPSVNASVTPLTPVRNLNGTAPNHRHGAQGVGRPHRDRRAQRGAQQREQQILGEQQADDAPRSGAEREPDADLAIARAGPRQHQVRGVAAGPPAAGAASPPAESRERR